MTFELEVVCKDGTIREDRSAILDTLWGALEQMEVDVGTKIVIELVPEGAGQMVVKITGTTK